jgi:hypothetical protein
VEDGDRIAVSKREGKLGKKQAGYGAYACNPST